MAPRHLKSSPVYVIDRIVDKRIVNNCVEYLVKWQDYTSDDDTWEPAESFCSESPVRDFEKRLAEKRNSKQPEKSKIKSKRNPSVQTERSIAQSADNASTSNPTCSTNPTSSTATSTTRTIIPIKMPARRTRRARAQVNRDNSPTPSRRQKAGASNSANSSSQSKSTGQLPSHEDGEKEVHFEMDPQNGLVGKIPSNERHMKLVSEMDKALRTDDDFMIMKKVEYTLSRLILIAKRPEGMVAYVRLVHTTNSELVLFECVPLEIVLALYPQVVLAYMQKRAGNELEAHKQQAASSRNVQ
ncbi:hypothetical protein M3Y94_01310600 [Aphelenchoides besseyi]|nr:hypothetical protein M3Y94_01310600 [Aphelenchoides besseyi]KAI6220268.1 hypothetical protein M3Y95_01067100 [Aphelenchoides besseyi]